MRQVVKTEKFITSVQSRNDTGSQEIVDARNISRSFLLFCCFLILGISPMLTAVRIPIQEMGNLVHKCLKLEN
ncbi:hypothetical protein D3Z45_02030 [Lachnospiraceae bacterium]|nr:hypothetical protein [Lachnospiraceae bacterium]